MNKGWIKLHRQILECDIWIGIDDEEDEPFDRRSAWIDLLLKANHSDKQLIFNYEPIIVTRGQLITSVRKLAKRWSWSVTKTYKYLNLLSDLGMIDKKSDSTKTLLTIVNYGVYQDDRNTSETETKHKQNADETQSGHKQEYKELKNERIKEINNIYSSNFEEFWKVYPRKVDKAKANKCYQARVKEGWSEDELLKAAKAYADSCKKNGTEDKYIKHGATFLSAGTPFTDYLKGSENNESVGTNEGHYDERARRLLASRGVFLS